jgi:hypothetical protein
MADLKISDEILNELQQGLQSIADQLKSSANFGHDIAGLTGHDGLSSKVSSFAGDWDVHRGKMVESTLKVHDEVKTISDGFEKLDTELKGALENKKKAN